MGALRGFVVSASSLGLVAAALSGVACSGDDNTGTGGTSSSTSPSSSSGGGREGSGGEGGEGGSGGVGGSGGSGGAGGEGGSGGASAQAPYRAGPERLMAAEHDFGGSDKRILRCPLGSLLTAIEIAHPDQASPPSAELLRLVCSPLDEQGALGPKVLVEGPFEIPAGWVFTPVSCPAGQAATRITGSYEEDDATVETFTSLGLGCHAPTAVADGAAGGASTPSQPASFGPEGPKSFDDGCPAGAGVAGIVVRYTALFGIPKAAGFSSLRGLCRDVLHETVPGGGAWDLSKPFGLGAVTDVAPISLTTFPLPGDNTKVTRDCPDGSVVTSVNGGKTSALGPHSLSDIWLTCRALGSQAELGAPVLVGGTGTPGEAPCLDGAAVGGLRFTKQPAAGAGFPDTSADVGGDCVLPVNTPTSTEPSLPPWAPLLGGENEMPWLTMSCPAGAVLTGVNLWGAFPEGDGALGGVGARCRMVTR